MDDPKAKFLIVEDSDEVAGLLRSAVERSWPESSTARVPTVQDAFNHMQRARPDLVLLDLNLPDARGLEALERMRERFPVIPVVVVTGQDDDMLALKAIGAGAQDFLAKGQIDVRKILRAVRFAIERSRAARAGK
jgi:DNA-binding response OmpR family regulator